MQPDILFYVVGSIAVFVLGLSKGGFAGVGMISTPLLAVVTGPVTAAALIFPLLIIQDVVAVAIYRRTYSRQILVTMIPGAALGIALAYVFASSVPGWAVELVLGVVSVVFSLQQIVRQLGASSAPQPAQGLGPTTQGDVSWLGVLSGVGSGFTSMIAHAGSPPFQFYVMPKRLDRDMYVGTSVLFFAATNVMKAPAFLALGQLSLSQLKTSLVFVPLAMASSWLGVRLVRSIDVRKFNVVITLILLGVSVLLIAQGVSGFMHTQGFAYGK